MTKPGVCRASGLWNGFPTYQHGAGFAVVFLPSFAERKAFDLTHQKPVGPRCIDETLPRRADRCVCASGEDVQSKPYFSIHDWGSVPKLNSQSLNFCSVQRRPATNRWRRRSFSRRPSQ